MDFFEIYFGGFITGIISFYNSPAFSVIKFILGIYTAVLLVDVVLLLVQRGVSGNLRETIFGINMPDELVKAKKKNRLRLQWEKIKKQLESENESDYKAAIVSADDLVDDLLKRMGYKGENMDERLDGIVSGQIENLEDLKKAHVIKNRIIQEEDFEVSKEDAEKILGIYEEFLSCYQVFN